MKKNLFKWMMAIAIVATPMAFTSCGSDDDDNNNSNQSQNGQISYSLEINDFTNFKTDMQGYKNAKTTIVNAMYTALFQAFGKTYDSSATYVNGTKDDAEKVLNAMAAAHSRLKDTDMKNGRLVIVLNQNNETLNTYSFGSSSPLEDNETITFENQQLNEQNFWAGDGVGKYSYKEKMATVTGTFSVWEGGFTSWSGFAISGRTETSFSMKTLTPDQYNNAVGGGYNSKNFLVVYDAFNDYECIEFEKPVYLASLRYINSAYALTSMENGENNVEKFTREDWFTCNVICLGENNDTIKVKELHLALKNTSPTSKFIKAWTLASIRTDGVKKIKFSFDGSQKIVPSYVCIDNIMYNSEE